MSKGFKTTFRTQTLFAGIISQAISFAKTELKCLSDGELGADATTETCQKAVFTSAVEMLREEKTSHLFYAAGAAIPTLTLDGSLDGANTLLDNVAYAFARIITNDVMSFVNAEVSPLEEIALNESFFSVNLDEVDEGPAQMDANAVSDEFRNEQSGANIDPSKLGDDDGDCAGGACKI